MASNDDESSIAPALDWMKCNICLDRFTNPRVLPCLHTFCEKCLRSHIGFYCSESPTHTSSETRVSNRTTYTGSRNGFNEDSYNALRQRFAGAEGTHSLPEFSWRQYRERNRLFPCPTCREKISLPSAGINGFRHDFRVSQLQEWMKGFKEKQEKIKENKKHQRRNSCGDELNVNDTNKKTTQCLCWYHPQEVLSIICVDCDSPGCTVCSIKDHNGHQMITIKEGLDLYRDNLKSLCTALNVRSTQLQRASEKLTAKERDIFTKQTKIVEKIHEVSEETIKRVRGEEKKLIMELKDRTRSNISSIRKIRNQMDHTRENMENIQEYSMSALDGDLTADLISSYQDLIGQIDAVLEKSLMSGKGEVQVTSLQFLKAKSKIKLGRIKHREQAHDITVKDSVVSELKQLSPRYHSPKLREKGKHGKKLKNTSSERVTMSSQPSLQQLSSFGRFGTHVGEFNSPGDVCFLPRSRGQTESFVVADINNNRLQIFNINGTFVKTIAEGQIKPWGITTTKDGNIVVSDTLEKCIKIFNQEGRCLQKFGKFLCPCGVAINSDGHFVVTDFFSASVYIIDISGKMLRKFDFRDDCDEHMSGQSNICVSRSDNIIISDISNKSIKLYDNTGRPLYSVQCNDIQMTSNNGICLDHHGNLLIADPLGSKVTMLSKEGQIISHFDIKTECAINPNGIAEIGNTSQRHLSPSESQVLIDSTGIECFGLAPNRLANNEMALNGMAENEVAPTGIAVSAKGHFVCTYSKSNQVNVYKLRNKQCALVLRLPTNEGTEVETSCSAQQVQF